MKKLLSLGLMLLNLSAFCQQSMKHDTIYVGIESTSYLIFDEPISLCNLGSKDYEAKADNPRMLFVRAKNPYAKLSTIVVTYGEEIYTAYLAYSKNVRPFYDFRKTAMKEDLVETKQKQELKQLETKLKKLSSIGSNSSFVSETQNILVKLLNIYNDNKATYLRFSLKNQSSIIYDLDYVSFAYIEKRKHKSKKMNVLNAGLEEIEPLVKVEKLLTEANKNNEYLYALPLYSTTEDGYLQIIFREKAGLRSVSFEIPFKKILNAELL